MIDGYSKVAGKYKDSDKYQLLIHFAISSDAVQLLDENGIPIEIYNESLYFPATFEYPSITGQENLSTGAISYNSFNVNILNNSINSKITFQKILIPPNFSVTGISAGLFIELDNLEELKGLL